MTAPFALALFTTDGLLVRAAAEAGIDAIVVDWERIGKDERQRGADTQIGTDGPGDLARVRETIRSPVICRLNPPGKSTEAEVDLACALGADEVLLPMVEEASDVVRVLDHVRGRCGVGILVETPRAVAAVDALAALLLTRVYVGLNDLAISRGTPNIFMPLVDGLLDEIRRPFRVPFGFGGLTLPEAGHPIPCRLLIGEMERLGCSFAFLRRSFLRDVRGTNLPHAVALLRRALSDAAGRTASERESGRRELEESVRAWPGTLFPIERHA